MPGLVFHFENPDVDVYSGRDIDLDAWGYAAKIPGDITDMKVVNLSTHVFGPLDQSFTWEIVTDINQLTLTGTKTYMIMPGEHAQETNLFSFDHMTDWYIFGPAAGWGGVHPGVCVPQHNPAIALHAVHACSNVMFHRYQIIGGPA